MSDRHDQIRQRAEPLSDVQKMFVLLAEVRRYINDAKFEAAQNRVLAVEALLHPLSDRLASLEGQNETLNALVEEKEVSWIQDVLDHWFIQGGVAQFGWPQRDGLRPANADELVSQILEVVRATIALPPPPSPETRE